MTESTFNFCINDYICINSKYRCINAENNKIYNFMSELVKNSINKFNEMKVGETQITLEYLIKYRLLVNLFKNLLIELI